MPLTDFVIQSTTSTGLFAYGPAPGMELIPYFLALLAWIGAALVGIFISPILAVYRRLRGSRTSNSSAASSAVNESPVIAEKSDPSRL